MLEYKTYNWKTLKVPNNDYNKWAIAMLEFIWNKEWWEETENEYFKLFFKWVYESKS